MSPSMEVLRGCWAQSISVCVPNCLPSTRLWFTKDIARPAWPSRILGIETIELVPFPHPMLKSETFTRTEFCPHSSGSSNKNWYTRTGGLSKKRSKAPGPIQTWFGERLHLWTTIWPSFVDLKRERTTTELLSKCSMLHISWTIWFAVL